jgi:uncharacterized cupredoxin-like copper-binding protein
MHVPFHLRHGGPRRAGLTAASGAPGAPVLAMAPVLVFAFALALAGCGAPAPEGSPRMLPGTSAAPREVNIIARDYGYVPSVVDLVPGETVLLHVVNAGLMIHDAILGDMPAQMAWESAEAPFADSPPGPTPIVPEPPGFTGIRIVVGSGERRDVTWTVPADAATAEGGWFVGCHIPGHWARGMVVPIRFRDAAGRPLSVPGPSGGASTTPAGSPGAGG